MPGFFYALKEKTYQSYLVEVFPIWAYGVGLEESELYAKTGFQEKIRSVKAPHFNILIKFFIILKLLWGN
jgi:hypothetical protein